MMDERFTKNPNISQLIKNLRGGDFTTALIGNFVFILMCYGIWLLSGGAEGFVIHAPRPGWGLPNGIYNPPGLVRPIGCGTEVYSQSLKTWEDRNQENPNDRWFLIESRPELVMRRGQSKYKVKYHGALAGLPYSVKNNGSTSTAKTEENVDTFMDVVEHVVYDPNSIWHEEGTYQANTDRKLETINIYNQEHNRIAVFLRSTGEFITFCEPSLIELEDLQETSNFGGQDNWFSTQPKNLPPEKPFSNDFTPKNTFESDVMGMSPLNTMTESATLDSGFTPINSFESDVLGITLDDLDLD